MENYVAFCSHILQLFLLHLRRLFVSLRLQLLQSWIRCTQNRELEEGYPTVTFMVLRQGCIVAIATTSKLIEISKNNIKIKFVLVQIMRLIDRMGYHR